MREWRMQLASWVLLLSALQLSNEQIAKPQSGGMLKGKDHRGFRAWYTKASAQDFTQ